MNKIYKVVWSKVRNAYVVVSELAKRNSKTKSQHTARVSHSLLSLAVVSSLALGLVSTVTLPAEAAQRVVAGRYPGAQDNDTMAVGANATATGAGAVSVGTATANGEDALAVGTDASATGIETIAIGGATAAINYSIAMGDGAVAGGTYSVGGVTQSGANAVAIGKSALAYGINDVVIGANQTAIAPTTTASEDTPEGTGLSSALGGRVMIGHDNIAYGRAGNSVIVGSNNRSNAIHGIAIGQNAYAGQPDGSTLAYENTMSISTNTRSYSTDAIAIGNNAVAGNTDTSRTSYDGNGLAAAAIGSAAKATSFHTVAIGSTSQATDVSATAIGDAAVASAVSTTAVGNSAKATSIGSLAAGAAATASDQYTIAVGNSAKATALRSMALGYGAVSSGGGAVAIGRTSQATGSYANSLGYENIASGASSFSVGYHTYAYGTRSIAIGREAVSGTSGSEGNKDTIAIGSTATTQADSAIAIGNAAKTDGAATSSIALGKNAATGIADSVAIGSNSSTTRATDTTSQGWNNQDSTWTGWLSTKGNAGTTSGGVWNSSAGVVSIGTDGFAGNAVTRKLTGLAAGVYDTDAVNMKQWTNTMLATTGDYQVSGSTQYGSDGTPRTATKLLNESLKITGGVDTTLYEQSDFATNPNIGAFISNNTVTLRLNKALTGLTSAAFTDSDGNRTAINGKGVYITPASGSRVTLTTAGLNNGNNRITNVAAGTANTDAVNVSQLNQAIAGVSTGSGTTTTVTVEGGTAAGTGGTYTGNNLQLTSTTGTGTATYDLKLADNVTLGSTGTSGTDGSLTVNGKDGESVAINGSDGSIALTGADGSTATVAAGTAANDVNGTSVNRITVGGQTVATLNDGMVYTGDTGSAAVKLNKTVNIVGGETDSSKLSTDNNIGIVAAQDGDNGKLTVRLAKDITGLNTVTAGDATIGNQTETTASGVAQTGSYVTGLDNTTWNVTNPDIVTGRAATEDQLKTVSDAVTAVADGTSENATGGFGLTDDSGTAVKQDLGKTIQIAGDGNVTTTADAANGKITVGLSNTIGIGTSGSENGTVTVNGADGSAVAINGADGSISLNTGSGSPITIQAGSSVNDVTGSPVNRITVGGQTVATMNDGMKYGGDFGTVSNVKLNNQVDVKGEATTEADLTTGNIGVVSSQAGDNGLLVVKLNKDINLGENGSVTTGNTTINNSGLTITNGPSVTSSGINAGGSKITNVATGTDGTDAVNVDQLTKAIAGVSSGEGSKTNLTVEGGTAAGTGGNYTGSNLQITEKTETTGATTYDVKLADNITLGSAADSAAGTEGTDSSITVNGKDGSAVAINGADGSIALNTADGSPVTIKAGTAANDVNGNSIDRITVGDATVATLDDGMVYTGDTGSAAVKLNKTVNIVGGETDASKLSTDNNIGIVAAQDGDNGKLTVRLAKDITGLNTVEAGDAVLGNQSVVTAGNVAQDGSYVTGLDNTSWSVTNPDIVTGRAATEDQLKTVSDAVVAVTDGTSENATGGFGLTDDSGTAVKQDLGKTIQIAGDGNVTTTAGDGKITVGLSNTVALGDKGTTDGSMTVNGADGSSVAINGSNGSIVMNTADGSPVTIQAGTSVNDVTGSPVNRITVGGQTVATMNDGMKYGGDFGTVSNVKLNNQVDVKGEATTEADLTTGNIGVVSSQAGDNGLLTVKLNKDINLGSTGSLTFGSGDSTVSISNSGLNNGGNKITNVATGTDGTDAVNVDQLTKAIAGVSSGEGSKTNLTVEGGTAAGTGGNYAGSNLQVTEKTETTGATTYDVKLADNITLGSEADSAAGTEGTDGSITVNGKDGSAVAINGADGSISLNTGSDSPITIQAGSSVNDVTGSPVNRITVGGQTVATMSDGLKFAGDDGQSDTTKVIPKTLNEQLDIVGGAEGDLTDKNIGVNNVNGQLKVQLVKDVDLGSTGSLTLGNTVVNNNGITITPATGDPVSLTGSGLDNGNNVISNVATGVKGTDAVNVDQLTKAIAGVSAGEGSKTNLTVEGGTAAGTGGNYAGSNLQITEKTETTGATTYDVKLADNITLGSAADSAAGTEGTDSSITVNGKDGSAVAINGADGSIALDTADGSPVTIKGGTAANDVNGKSIDRVTVGGATVATLDDGMVYTGDTGSAAVKLNKTVNIVGGETDSTKLSTDNNIGIVAEQDGDNGKLTVRLAKDITGLNTVTAGNAILGNQTTTTAGGASQTGSYVTGLGNTTWNVSDPDIVSGRAATEDQLKTVSDSLVDGTSENATGGFGLADGSGTTVKQDLGKTITVKGGVTDGTATTDNPDGVSNITTTVKDGALEVSLNKDLDLGSTGSITTGNTVINNDGVKVGDTALTTGGLTITNGPSVTTDGIDGGSKQITNVASGSDGTDAEGNKTYNTDTNAANIGDIKNITNTTVNNAKTELTNDGLNFTADSGDAVHRNLGETLNIAGDGNITTTSDATNGKITVGLSNTVAVGDKGSEDGSLTVNGADGSSVAINGSNGSITFNTGSGSPVNIAAGTQVNNLAGTPIDRITVGGATVATLDDGMKYGGDFGTVSNVKLNNQVNVKGEATTEANLTTGNIGVVSSQDGDNGLLVVKLNKDINLGEKGSVTTGNTVVNNSGLTITNGPSVTTGGIDAGGSKITNVATGTDGTDAVNVAQLEKRISDIAIGESKTTELTVEGGKAAPTDGTYAGNNLQVTASTTANGSPTYDVKLADNITLGSAADSESGTTGTDGSITLNGANGSSVAVNGANGSVTAKGTDGSAVAINGSDGSIVLNTGSVSPVTIQAGTSADNLAGTSVDRISVGGQTIATMSDGQKYAGDNAKEDGTNVIAKKLNEQLDVVGGADATRLTDNNIGVNNVNGQLKVQLAQNIDLGKDGSVTTGATVINNDGVTITPSTGNPVTLTGTGLNNGGNQITNVASGSDGVDADGNPTYNTTTNAANIGDLKNVNDALVNKGMDFTADSGDTVHRDLGEALGIVGDGQNITTTTDPTNGNITVALSNDISLGKAGTDGVDGKIGVNGKDGSSVVINGADGSIGLTGPAGEDGTPGTTVTIKAGDSVNNVEGNPVDRITAGGQTIATMSDGQKYAGDNAKADGTNVISKKLNEQLDIVGGADADKLTENNIGVNNVNGQLKVQLVKDIDLGTGGSVTMGNTVVNNSGVAIGSGDTAVTLTDKGLNNGGNQITNVASGSDGVDADGNPTYNTTTNAANIGDLKNVNDALVNKGMDFTADSGDTVHRDLGEALGIVGDGQNITTTTDPTNGNITVALSNDISLGKAGTDGVDGKIGVNGKDGSSVVINGADGSIGLTGPAGEDGTPGTTVTIKAGDSVNNVEGNPVDRITAGGQTIATMSDGQKYAGDNAKADGTNVISKKLNEQLDIVGGADADKLTENNIGVNNVNGQLKVQLAQNIDLGKDGSVTMGNTVVNNSGLTIANGPSVTSSGINAGGSKITNVAAGDVSATSTDAVNGSQLKDVQDIAEKHTKVTVEGGTEAGTTDYAGNNLQLKATTVDGQTTYDLKLADNLSIGEKGADGKDGVDGSIGVNGKDGSSVVINGTDGISIKGADGKDGVSITGKDGVDGVDGLEGHIGLNGKDGMTDIYTTPGQPGVNGKDGETMTRIIYTDPNGANHEVATLDDGMKYTGDTGSAAVALNKTVNIVGGETDSTKLSTDNNIGIVAEQADDNAKLTVRLAKDITGLNTVTAGDATIGNQTEVTAGGVAQTGSYVTGLDNTEWNMTSPDIVSGRAATEDQLKTVTDTVNALADGTSENATGGFGLTDDSGTAVKQDIGKTIQIAGDGNITTTADATSGKLTVGLSNTIALGEKASEDGTTEGADSSITVNGKDGSSVAINGADGTIALNTADGSPVTIAAGTQVNNLAGTPIDRITVGGATVATLDDGMKYYGDFGDVASVKLNNQVNVKGEANSEDDLTTGNIGVVSAQDGDNALLTVKLNKDINLGSTGSVTTGNTVINNSGVTITPTGGNPVTLTDAGLNNGSNKITNVAPGAINEDSMDAVNGSQLNEIRKLAGQHTYVTVEGGIEGDSAEYAGKNLLLQAKRDNNLTTYYDLKLSDNITLGSANDSEGTGGVDSSITLNGAAGSSVAINGGDGSIALTGANGSTATIAAGTSTPNLAGTAIDRITAGGSTVATLDDGMKYGGDFGDTSKVKLNNQVNVKGNAKNEADLTDGNIGVVSSQDGDNGQLLIKLNKDLNLGDTGSVTMGNTVINNGGVTIGSGTSAVTLTDKGLNNGGNQITNVASGTTGKTYDTSVAGQENYNNAANIGDLTTAINDVKNADNGGGFGLTADDGKSVKQDLGSTITVTGDNNIETKVTDDGKLQVGLKDNVDLGQNGSITAGNTTIDKDGVSTDKIAIKDSGISIDKDGINAGNTVIKDVGSGLGNTYDTSVAGQENYNNGANIGDVYNIAKGQADAVKAQSGKNITVGDDNKVNLNDNITLGDTTDPSKQVNIDGNGATVTAGSGDNQVKLDGSKGQISAGGAVLGNQENTANDGNPATGNYLTGLDNTKWDSNNIQSGRAATEDQLKVVDDKVNKGRVFQGDDGADNSVTVGLGDTLKLNGGADTSKLSSGNIGVVRNSSGDGLDIKLAKDLKDLDSVTTGNTTINDNGVTIKTVDSDRTITIQDSNVNMGNNVVSGVADGTVAPGSTEAINGGQLALRDQAINHLGGEVNKLDNRINRVGAGAAALAALHPQDFDPDDKWDFAFGYGHYRGANAGAFGAFYKPNEDTTFSVGGTIGGGENMINAGVSFKLGQGNNVSNSRVGMAKEIKHLRDDVAKLEDIVNRQSQMINQLTGQNPGTIESKGSELFPDVPANHWAYEYVTKLHQLGIIEGYPDGNFDGNRMMTRYEFAAVVYRAIMAGAASNAALQGDDTLDRLANEFSAELKYIRIDTIAKDKDGKPTIQRVRIVPENKQN